MSHDDSLDPVLSFDFIVRLQGILVVFHHHLGWKEIWETPMEELTAGGNQGAGNDLNDISPPPGTDMTGICFKDQLWLNTYPLDRNLVFEYFALSQFYDSTCNNELLRSQSIHPLDISHLS